MAKTPNEIKLEKALKNAKASSNGPIPWLKNIGIRTLPALTAGKHIAQLSKIIFAPSDRFSGYIIEMKWVTLYGLGGPVRLSLSKETSMDWVTAKNSSLTQIVLAAAGMAGVKTPNWAGIPSILRNTWFSIDLKLSDKGYLNLNGLEVLGVVGEDQEDQTDQDSPQDLSPSSRVVEYEDDGEDPEDGVLELNSKGPDGPAPEQNACHTKKVLASSTAVDLELDDNE